MTRSAPEIEVTVVVALPERATEIAVRLPVGATIADALDRSALAARHPDIDLVRARVGIFGKRADREAVLVHGDRVEIYRALIVDPKESRQKRAASARKRTPK